MHVVIARAALLAGILGAAGELAAQEKRPIPADEVQQAVRKTAAELYSARFERARTVAEKTALAKEILQAAMKVGDGSVDQYVLLVIARDVAAVAGDVETALQAVEGVAARFDVEAVKLKTEALKSAARYASLSTQHQAVAEAAPSVIDQLIAADDCDTAVQLCETARSAARESRQYAMVRKFTARAEALKKRAAAAKEYHDAMAVLEKDPTNPPANLAAGRYLCFVKGDWARGVSMLALGNGAPTGMARSITPALPSMIQ